MCIDVHDPYKTEQLLTLFYVTSMLGFSFVAVVSNAYCTTTQKRLDCYLHVFVRMSENQGDLCKNVLTGKCQRGGVVLALSRHNNIIGSDCLFAVAISMPDARALAGSGDGSKNTKKP